tara:strand:+ start:15 stop:131 length:117 start_codon:yes stop_codon:yes gene_type:complete
MAPPKLTLAFSASPAVTSALAPVPALMVELPREVKLKP